MQKASSIHKTAVCQFHMETSRNIPKSPMDKTLADTFLESIEHERDQDVATTEALLKSLPLKSLVKSGNAITNLTFDNLRTGLAGKLYLELSPDNAIDEYISRGDIKTGDIVVIRPLVSGTKTKSRSNKSKSDDSVEDQEVECTGVVYKILSQQCTITIENDQEQNAMLLCSFNRVYLVKTVNMVTYNRMASTMRKLNEFEKLPDNKIIQYLLNATSFHPQPPLKDITYHNKNLNDSQQHAVQFSIANEISIIHGPPGTGKTYTLVELILQLVDRGQRVLVCGPSNISVDTILERLAKQLPGDMLLRIGHPARLLETNRMHSLDILSKTGENGEILNDITKDIDKNIASIKKSRSYKSRREGWKEVRTLRKELRQREKKVIHDLILQSKVVVSTLHGASSRELCSIYEQVPKIFDVLIIDEVSQSLEPQCWIPLIAHYKSNISKLVLAGDNKQLPPTIKTEDDEKVKKVLGTTLFDRLVKNYGDAFKLLLNVQYRMNKDIMQFSSKQMYDGKLIAADSVAKKLLSDLPGVDYTENTSVPLIWYDTQGDDYPEATEDIKSNIASKYNESEALLVKEHLENLVSDNVPQEAIGIISPYNAQVSVLQRLINEQYPGVEISTVDGFQGREKEVIILTLVRSNPNFEVGFLKDERRLNVAMTRPKKQLCVIGNMEMLERSKNKYLKSWADWSTDNSEVRYKDITELL